MAALLVAALVIFSGFGLLALLAWILVWIAIKSGD